MSDFLVRQAQASDIQPLADLEQKVYGPLGTDVYDASYFSAWLDVHPKGLIVAEYQGRVVGYHYAQCVDFDLPSLITSGQSYNDYTDMGYTRNSHSPQGRDMQTVSMLSDQRGAGHAMITYLLNQVQALNKRSLVAASRISGFDSFFQSLPPQTISKEMAAIWYCRETARLRQSPIAREFPLYQGPPLPKLTQPDPILGAYLRYHPDYTLVALLPDWMKDPASGYFGALVKYENPDHTGSPI